MIRPWKEWAEWKWRAARHTPEGKAIVGQPAEVLVWIPVRDRRRRDPHNYVSTIVKPIVDGLTDQYASAPGGKQVRVHEGIWPDDDPRFVTIREPKLYVGEDCVVEILPRLGNEPEVPPQATV